MKSLISDPKMFLDHFAHAFGKDSCIVLKVSNTSKHNRFMLCLRIYGVRYVVNVKHERIRYDSTVCVNGLDRVFKDANSQIMLRDGVEVTIDDLVERYGCDEKAVYKCITSSLRKAFKTSKWNPKNAFIAVRDEYQNNGEDVKIDIITLPMFSTFEELAAYIDLKV